MARPYALAWILLPPGFPPALPPSLALWGIAQKQQAKSARAQKAQKAQKEGAEICGWRWQEKKKGGLNGTAGATPFLATGKEPAARTIHPARAPVPVDQIHNTQPALPTNQPGQPGQPDGPIDPTPIKGGVA